MWYHQVRSIVHRQNQEREALLRENLAFSWWTRERLVKMSNFLHPFSMQINTVSIPSRDPV
jgi:hypothetical protein